VKILITKCYPTSLGPRHRIYELCDVACADKLLCGDDFRVYECFQCKLTATFGVILFVIRNITLTEYVFPCSVFVSATVEWILIKFVIRGTTLPCLFCSSIFNSEWTYIDQFF
jgi:hypothetical protein